MTMYEMNFSLLVEDMLQNIDQPEYRQIIVEVCGLIMKEILSCAWVCYNTKKKKKERKNFKTAQIFIEIAF